MIFHRRLRRRLNDLGAPPPGLRPRTAEELLDERVGRMTSLEMVMRMKELKAIAQARLTAGTPPEPMTEKARQESEGLRAAIVAVCRSASGRFDADAVEPNTFDQEDRDDGL